jgi:hypothetical protein
MDVTRFCWSFFEKNDETAVFFEKKLQKCLKDDKGMRVAVQLQNMFVCTLFTSSGYLVGGRVGREVGAVADTFYHQDNSSWLVSLVPPEPPREEPRGGRRRRRRGVSCDRMNVEGKQ